MTETAGGAFLLAGECLSISSLEHKSIREGGRRGGRAGASLAGGVSEILERKHAWLALTIDSEPMLTGKPVAFKALI